MMRVLKRVTLVGAVCLLAVPAFAQNNEAQSKTEQPVPAWVRRGIPGEGIQRWSRSSALGALN